MVFINAFVNRAWGKSMDTVPKGQGPQGSSCIVVGLFGEEVWVSSFFFSFFEKRKWEVRRPSQIPHNVYDRRCLNSYTLAAFFFFLKEKISDSTWLILQCFSTLL